MSANIPFDIQLEIIKRVFPVKSVIRFRSVSKQWKSLIDSPEFINNYRVNQHHLLITYKAYSEDKYVSIIDDDSFPLHKFYPIVPPTVKPATTALMLDCSHGLVCLYGFDLDLVDKKRLIVLWNPSIRKSVGIVLPFRPTVVGFGVCPQTSDPKIIKITNDWRAEVFTLSARAWRNVSLNLPCKSLKFAYKQVVIDGVIYWHAYDVATKNNRIISFDLTSEEFGQVHLPDSLPCRGYLNISIFKLNESLVVLHHEYIGDSGKHVCNIWMMLKNGVPKSLFTKLFTVKVRSSYDTPYYLITGFRKNGQPIVEQFYKGDGYPLRELEVYEPHSQHISGLGIYGSAFMMTSYTESLLLLNHSDG